MSLEEGYVKTEVGVMLLHAKEHQGLLATTGSQERAQGGLSLIGCGKNQHGRPLPSRTIGPYISDILSCQACGTLIRQLEETHTDRKAEIVMKIIALDDNKYDFKRRMEMQTVS